MQASMEQYRSENDEFDFLRRKNANRPSVIYFHGFLNDEKSLGETEDQEFLSTNDDHRVKRCLSLQDESNESGDEERKAKEDTTICSRDLECLETDEDCLRKRHRTSFTSFQLKRLEEEFESDPYIVGMKRWRLSSELEIPEKQIKIWFQNKRTKVKKHCSNCTLQPRHKRSRTV